ncbi:YraN family protein [Actinokineospora sp. G85]|uniref:YraN family protein n=1 Tax=Actinokineospora sp. G85 TaxID=3406626 RepID=UPI003C707A50
MTDQTPAPHLATGRRGEDIAARYLTSTGLVVLARNWRCELGELDLVCADGAGVVVCEVKTRSGAGYGTPAEAVDDAKARRIRALGVRWLRENDIHHCPVRHDIVSVLLRPGAPAEVAHLRGAF